MKSEVKRILVVGGSGFVGSTLARELSSDFEVICTYHNEFTAQKGIKYVRFTRFDDKEIIKNFVKSIDPSIIIYAAGTNELNYTELDQNIRPTQLVQSTGASHFLTASDFVKAKFIYISSDYVFSGVDGNYDESHSAIPPSNLGKAKLGAENFIRSRSSNQLVIRCAPLLGRGTLDHPSWIDKIRESVLVKRKIKLPIKSIHNPVHVDFLVATIRKAIELDLKGQILHVGGLSRVSLFECAQIVAQHLKIDGSFIEPSDSSSTAMPSDYSLNTTETLKTIQIDPWLLEQSLERLL